jgi:hypothetical protein
MQQAQRGSQQVSSAVAEKIRLNGGDGAAEPAKNWIVVTWKA